MTNTPRGTTLAGRLLVVDYDFFFPNPMLQENPGPHVLLYDWQARENLFYVQDAWYTRAAPFWLAGLDLPRTLSHEGFWDRFQIDGDFITLLGDSNLHAGRIFPDLADLEADGWQEVWLFDAHHDCGYRNTRSLKDFVQRDTLSCEDWMLNHAARGTELHVRYPVWRAAADGSLHDCEPPPAVDVDRTVDDGQPIDGWFDTVYICRSGTWVPSWCDDAFEDFVSELGGDGLWIDEFFPRDRSWDDARARAELEILKRARALLQESRT